MFVHAYIIAELNYETILFYFFTFLISYTGTTENSIHYSWIRTKTLGSRGAATKFVIPAVR